MSRSYRGYYLRFEGPGDQTAVLAKTREGHLGECIAVYTNPISAMEGIDWALDGQPKATSRPVNDDADVSYRIIG